MLQPTHWIPSRSHPPWWYERSGEFDGRHALVSGRSITETNKPLALT